MCSAVDNEPSGAGEAPVMKASGALPEKPSAVMRGRLGAAVAREVSWSYRQRRAACIHGHVCVCVCVCEDEHDEGVASFPAGFAAPGLAHPSVTPLVSPRVAGAPLLGV